MSQRDTLVARAIVAYEIGELGRGTSPLPSLTTQRIVDKYGMQWGRFTPSDYLTPSADRARQLVRNELNRAFRNGQLAKLRDENLKKVREGSNVVYITNERSRERFKLLQCMGYVREVA